jgi:protein tyrosine phosphatase (PTP) superfamily phosphohydrolase (DUF442 family)
MHSISRGLACIFVFSLPAFAGSSVQGIENFYQVDGHVYRGAQPDESGFQYLAKIGVKTILDLRESGERAFQEQQMVTALGLKYVNVAMSGLTPPTEEQISQILSLLEDTGAGAVFVHCKRGADRTGAVIAAYRIAHDNWSNDRALAEAKSDGMAFFQFPRKAFIRDFRPQIVMEAKNSPDSKAPANEAPAIAVSAPASAK